MKQKSKVISLILLLFISTISYADLPACVTSHYDDAPILHNAVVLDAPDIAENGAVISVGIKKVLNVPTDRFVREVSFYNEFRKEPVAKFMFGKTARAEGVKTRMRLRESSNIYAVAQLDNGKLLSGESYIKVTIEGCGGGGLPEGRGEAVRVCKKQ